MTDADKITNREHFGSDPAEIRIRKRSNLDLNPGSLQLRLHTLVEVCAVVYDGVERLTICQLCSSLSGVSLVFCRSPHLSILCTSSLNQYTLLS